MNKNVMVIAAVVVGVLALILMGVYWLVPAGALPVFIPGFEAGSTRIHYTHGVAALVVALALFAFAWFQSGKKSAPK
ncbi:MAG: hypothetical protein WCF84_19895 [Anaerolineae bacterium]